MEGSTVADGPHGVGATRFPTYPETLLPSKPPLELAVEVKDSNGVTYRWDSQGPADQRPQGLNFSTKRGDGFASGGCTLARRADADYNDINLFDEFVFFGADGSTAYEGQLAASPRTVSEDGHSISVQLAGHMAGAKYRKFSEIYVDRDMAGWHSVGVTRQATLSSATVGYNPPEGPLADTTGGPSIKTFHIGTWDRRPYSEAMYDAGPGVLIGSIYYAWQKSTDVSAASNWEWEVFTSASDSTVVYTNRTGNLEAAGPGSGTLTATTPQRYGGVELNFSAAGAAGVANANYAIYWQNLAVFGSHGLTKRGTAPEGFYASDVMRDVAQRFCPKLNTAGVQDTTYVIPHLVFRDAYPFDAFLEVNKYHLWDLGVWENKTLTFRPTDLSDYDWEIRLDDPGVTVDFQGDSTENLANGIRVSYTDVTTGKPAVITPDDDATLADTSVSNPANKWGLKVWTDATLTSPTTATAAADIGRALLAEFNAPKAPGTYRVRGHIKDRAGHWQPVWKVRAGDTIAITSSTALSDRPHLIVETSYTHDDTTVQIGVDNTLPRVDAVLDRIQTALTAANLT